MQVPPRPTADRPRRRLGPRIAIVVVAITLLVLLMSARGLAVFYTDSLWFSNLGAGHVFSTLVWAHVTPALVFSAAMFVLMLVNLVVADRLAPQYGVAGSEDEVIERYRETVAPYAGRLRVGIALLFGVLVGVGASGEWQQWLLFRHHVSWGVRDPQFGKDIGFYVFELPFLKFIAEWLFVVLFVVLLVTAVFHYLNGGIRFQSGFQRVTPQVKAHLSVILALMAFVKTAQYWLGRYDLVYSHRGPVDGATFTDVHAQVPALEFLVLISIVGGLLFVVNIWRRGWTLPVIAVGLWAFISIVLGTAYPAYMQRFQVQASEASKERPYIARNITATRTAYGLDRVTVRDYDSTGRITSATADDQQTRSTLQNARLWDPEILGAAIRANETRRSYYQLSTPAVDRYKVGLNAEQPVLVSSRGLNTDGVPSRTWVNEHLAYTHGQGAVVASANSTGKDNAPDLLLSGLPPQGASDLLVNQADVYFGADLSGFVVGGTKTPEVELTGDREVGDHYRGSTGVQLSSFMRRAAFAMRFGDINLVVSDRITDSSKILFARSVRERVARLAPFLRLDSQPYPVILPSGRMVWVLDAYTATSRYPYSQQLRDGDVTGTTIGAGFNYIRNSVKAVVDAYDGTVKLFVVDPSDPLVRSYRLAFPGLFTDASQMPDGLAAHLRVPVDMFKVQTRQLERYHVTDADRFYSGTEQWAIAPAPDESAFGGSTQGATTDSTVPGNDGGRNSQLDSRQGRVEPQYLTMQLPGDSGQEFVLTRSFVPAAKDAAITNQMSAFIAARSDGFRSDGSGSYGSITIYRPTTSMPSLIEAANKINSDRDFSEQRTLLGRDGSSLLLGEIQLLPVAKTVLYVQPIYIQGATAGSVPKLQFVAAYANNRAAVDTTLGCALQKLTGATTCSTISTGGGGTSGGGTGGGTNSGGGTSSGGGGTATQTEAQRLAAIQAKYSQYLAATKAGDFASAGKLLADLGQLIEAPVRAPGK